MKKLLSIDRSFFFMQKGLRRVRKARTASALQGDAWGRMGTHTSQMRPPLYKLKRKTKRRKRRKEHTYLYSFC